MYNHKERQVTAYIKFRVKLHHEDGVQVGGNPIQNILFRASQLYTN